MRRCDSCGKVYQESKDVFCPHCGAVAEKKCTHGSSFDSRRYDRGEIYRNNNTQYQNTTYNKSFEPHAQRRDDTYNTSQSNSGYGEKIPQINLPDFKALLSKGKGKNGKPFIGVIVFAVILVFNALTSLIGSNDVMSDVSVVGDESVVYVEEEISELYTVVDEATVEIVFDEDGFKTFAIEINSMEFDEYLPESLKNDIASGVTAKELLSENTFVEALVCVFSTKTVKEEDYNNALNDAYLITAEQTVEGKCRYEFAYSFDYGEIVNFIGGVDFYLDDGRYINAELPFGAFSVSEDGEITYYTAYSDEGTHWDTVFEECSNKRETDGSVVMIFDKVNIVEAVSDNG